MFSATRGSNCAVPTAEISAYYILAEAQFTTGNSVAVLQSHETYTDAASAAQRDENPFERLVAADNEVFVLAKVETCNAHQVAMGT